MLMRESDVERPCSGSGARLVLMRRPGPMAREKCIETLTTGRVVLRVQVPECLPLQHLNSIPVSSVHGLALMHGPGRMAWRN